MGSIFGGGKQSSPPPPPPPPPITPPPPVPTTDEASMRAESADALAKRRGRRASVLTGDTGVEEPTKKKTLIGS